MARLISVNLAVPHDVPLSRGRGTRPSGIDKRPTDRPVFVRDPGPRKGGLGSGLVGDLIGSDRHHGGAEQAVYAYAREDLDAWQTVLGRPLPDGCFGENATTEGLDVTGALIGERWAIGDELVLEVTVPRIPCNIFRRWLGERGWERRFTEAGVPGAYLRVVRPGSMCAGDTITVTSRPAHDVTIGTAFRALTLEPALRPALVAAQALVAAADVVDRAAGEGEDERDAPLVG